MLLSVWVLAIFYNTQFAEISLVDDFDALNGTLTQEYFSWGDTFIPRSVAAGYYRPLIGVSYWLDKMFWFLSPRNMHFESVLGHLLNCTLLFSVAKKASNQYLNRQESYLPLSIALLFSVHPIVTESVNWISGRTDIMMGTFVLISMLCVLHYNSGKSRSLFVLALLSAGIAMLAKETALGYIIGLPLLMLRQTPSDASNSNEYYAASFAVIPFVLSFAIAVLMAIYTDMYWLVLMIACCYLAYLLRGHYLHQGVLRKSSVITRLVVLAPMIVGSLLFFVAIRKTVFTSSIGKIGQTVNLMLADTNYTISLFLGAIGFYVKKLFLPLPLNFFIHEIDPLYDLLGIAVLLLIIFLLTVNELPAVLALLGFLMMAPALPFAFGTIAWSSYAERYIYLSSAFWILAIGLCVGGWLEKRPHHFKYALSASTLLCVVAGYTTFSRNTVWKTNVSLMKDTVAQTPKKRVLHDIYIRALLNAGMTDEAEREFRYASFIAPAGSDISSDLSIGEQLIKQKRSKEALQLYQDALQRTKFSSEKLLSASIELVMSMQQIENMSPAETSHLSRLENDYRKKRTEITNNPSLLMEAGKMAFQAGSYREATLWFNKALSNVSERDVRMKKQIGLLKRESEEQQ